MAKPSQDILTHDEIMNMTREELYKRGKSSRDALLKRAKRLERKMGTHPGVYAPHGLALLRDEDNGIPMISKDMHLNTLRAHVSHAEHLKSKVTTTLSGAKQVQEQQIRMSLGLPKTGKLNAAEKRRYNEGLQYVKDNPDAMRVHWEAFHHWETENRHRNLDSGRLLEEFNAVYEGATQSGYRDLEDLTGYVTNYVNIRVQEEERRRDMSNRFENASKWGLED